MKRLSGIMMTVVITAFFVFQGFTQAPVAEKPQVSNQKAGQQNSLPLRNFVDKNNNGICDNFEARAKTGHGQNFVDKNGDGKCDNCQSDCKGKANGNCCGKGCGYGLDKSNSGQGCCGKGIGQGCQYRNRCSGMNQAPAKSAPGNQGKK